MNTYKGRTTCSVVYCKICNKVVDKSIRGQKQTCSIEHEIELSRRTSRKMYARKMDRDPDYCKKRNARNQFHIDSDPVLRAKYLAGQKAKYQKRKSDPRFLENAKRTQQRFRLRNKAKIDAYRLRYRRAIGEDAYQQQLQKINENRVQKQAEWLSELKKDPVAYEQYRAERREYERNLKAEKRLAQLQTEFNKMVNNDE